MAEQLQKSGLKRVESRELRRYRQFYQLYPQIRESVTPELNRLLLGGEFSPPTEKRELPTPELHNSGRAIITKLSFTHLAELRIGCILPAIVSIDTISDIINPFYHNFNSLRAHFVTLKINFFL